MISNLILLSKIDLINRLTALDKDLNRLNSLSLLCSEFSIKSCVSNFAYNEGS